MSKTLSYLHSGHPEKVSELFLNTVVGTFVGLGVLAGYGWLSRTSYSKLSQIINFTLIGACFGQALSIFSTSIGKFASGMNAVSEATKIEEYTQKSASELIPSETLLSESTYCYNLLKLIEACPQYKVSHINIGYNSILTDLNPQYQEQYMAYFKKYHNLHLQLGDEGLKDLLKQKSTEQESKSMELFKVSVQRSLPVNDVRFTLANERTRTA